MVLVCDQLCGVSGRCNPGASGEGAYAGGFSVCGAKVSRIGDDVASDVCAVYAVDDDGGIFEVAARCGGGGIDCECCADSGGDTIADSGGLAAGGIGGRAGDGGGA